jgi:hypothetical protein
MACLIGLALITAVFSLKTANETKKENDVYNISETNRNGLIFSILANVSCCAYLLSKKKLPYYLGSFALLLCLIPLIAVVSMKDVTDVFIIGLIFTGVINIIIMFVLIYDLINYIPEIVYTHSQEELHSDPIPYAPYTKTSRSSIPIGTTRNPEIQDFISAIYSCDDIGDQARQELQTEIIPLKNPTLQTINSIIGNLKGVDDNQKNILKKCMKSLYGQVCYTQ